MSKRIQQIKDQMWLQWTQTCNQIPALNIFCSLQFEAFFSLFFPVVSNTNNT